MKKIRILSWQAVETLALVLWVGFGIGWYWSAAGRAASLRPMDLGLDYLFLMVLFLFLGSCMAKGFTVVRILLLLVPFAACNYLSLKLTALSVARGSQADWYGLRPLLLGTALLLFVVLAWIAVFPLPFSWSQVRSDLATRWRRVEWSVLALLAGLFAVVVWNIAASAATLQSLGDLTDAIREAAWLREYAGRTIQRFALYTYLFLFFKVALRFELAERYPAQVPPASSG